MALWASLPIENHSTPSSRAMVASSTLRSCRHTVASSSSAFPRLAASANRRRQSATGPTRRPYIRAFGWASTCSRGCLRAVRYRSVWSSFDRNAEWSAPSTRSRLASESSMSRVPSGKTSTSIERSTRNASPSFSNPRFIASIARPCSESSSGVMPLAIVSVCEWSVMATNGRPRDLEAATISSSGRLPSLHVVCIWRSAHGLDSHAGSASRVRRTSAYVRNPRRVSSGSGIGGGASSHASIRAATHGPTDLSSVRGRPEAAISPASSGQNREALEARSSALRRWSASSRAAPQSSSPRSPFVSDVVDACRSDGRAPVSSRLRRSPTIRRRCPRCP